MVNIILPKTPKINDPEELVVPWVKCDVCGNATTSGLHQQQLKLIKKSRIIKIDGRWIRIPPVMKKIDLYMCNDCVNSGKKWPGKNPR